MVRDFARQEDETRALADLPAEEWRVFHDVRWPGRGRHGVAHLAVGPAGVLVIDTRSWSGEVEIVGGVLRLGGRRRDRAVSTAASAAFAVSALVPEVDPAAVRPVLCLRRDEPVFGWVGEVMVCSTTNLAKMLTSRPRVLDEATVHGTAELLRNSVDWSPAPGAPATRLASGVRRRTMRRRPSPLRSVVLTVSLGLVAAAGAGVLVPRVVDLAETGRQRLEDTAQVGERVTVAGNPLRPELQISVDRVRRVRVVRGDARRPAPAVAAEVTIRNTGDQVWVSGPGTSVAGIDEGGRTRSRDPRVSRVVRGRLLPGRLRLREGQAAHGLVVLDPEGTGELERVRVSVGPGLVRSVDWAVD
jgi:hypothetical protein